MELVHAGGNLGFAAAVNLGLESCSEPHVLLLNPDAVASPAAVGALRDAVDARPDVAAAGPALFGTDGAVIPISARRFPSGWWLFSRLCGLTRAARRRSACPPTGWVPAARRDPFPACRGAA